MSLCHCVYKIYYRSFVLKNMSLKKICLSVIVSTKHIIVPLSLNNMSLCLCNVICTLVLIYKVSRY